MVSIGKCCVKIELCKCMYKENLNPHAFHTCHAMLTTIPTMLTINLREMEETCLKYLIYYKKKARG